MVEMKAVYEGDLHCSVKHGPSGTTITTDAPVDNEGKGESFSPTDLVGAAVGSCMMTIMGIVAKRRNLDLKGTTAHVTKEMAEDPIRHIKKLAITITFPQRFSQTDCKILEQAALTCPVHKSLHPDVDAPVHFVYPS